MTLDLSFDCNESPVGKCIPVEQGGGAGQYDPALWSNNFVWAGIGWARPTGVPHEFHYNFVLFNGDGGYGSCDFTAEARADFDGDGVFSSYSISGHVDELTTKVGELVVVDPFE